MRSGLGLYVLRMLLLSAATRSGAFPVDPEGH